MLNATLPEPCLSLARRAKAASSLFISAKIAAWSARVNEKQRAFDWQFTIDKAGVK